MSYADCAGIDVTCGVGFGVDETLGEADGLIGVGLAVFATCQINFFPLFTHFSDAAPDFAIVPSFTQVAPGVFAAVLEEAKDKGVERIARANIAHEMRSEDFLGEVVMRKTVPPSEC